MILNCGKVVIKRDAVAKLKSVLPEYSARCRQSAGCLRFTMTIEDEGAGELAVWELWQDKASLDGLLEEAFVQSFIADLTPSILSADMNMYHVVAKAGDANT